MERYHGIFDDIFLHTLLEFQSLLGSTTTNPIMSKCLKQRKFDKKWRKQFNNAIFFLDT